MDKKLEQQCKEWKEKRKTLVKKYKTAAKKSRDEWDTWFEERAFYIWLNGL